MKEDNYRILLKRITLKIIGSRKVFKQSPEIIIVNAYSCNSFLFDVREIPDGIPIMLYPFYCYWVTGFVEVNTVLCFERRKTENDAKK